MMTVGLVPIPVLCPVVGCWELITVEVPVTLGVDSIGIHVDSPALLAEVELHVITDHAADLA